MSLDALYTHDLSDDIARLPKQPGYQVLPPRTTTRYITFHYSAVVYGDRSEAAELRTIIEEARFHLRKDWRRKGATRPAYGDGYMYDVVVLLSGAIVKTRERPQQLWHCNNAMGNALSFSAHVPLGGNQDLTPEQRDSLVRLLDTVRDTYHLPRKAVVGHCQWPLGNDLPRSFDSYAIAPGQSSCPGRVLFRHVAAYRLATDALADVRTYRVRAGTGKINIRASATTAAAKVGALWPGDRWEGIEQAGEWVDQGGTRSNRWVVGLDGRAVWRPVFE